MKLALYTTVYPAVLPLFTDFYRSVEAQRGPAADLWIGLDQLAPSDLESALGRAPQATFVEALPGSTPTSLRSRALEQIVGGYDAVVLVDSDDLLYPSRLEAASSALEEADLVGCALDLIDSSGAPLGARFGSDPAGAWLDVEPHCNLFGFSNSAYRCSALSACLPAPADTVLLDWYVATLALAAGARAWFDPVPRMAYRQYPANLARVRPPFSRSDLARGVALMGHHYRLLAERSLPPAWRAAIDDASARVRAFERCVLGDDDATERYLDRVQTLKPTFRWWEWIANRRLEATWIC